MKAKGTNTVNLKYGRDFLGFPYATERNVFLYYDRLSYELTWSNYGSTTTDTLKYGAQLTNKGTPARPAGFSEYATFKGWYTVPVAQITDTTVPFDFSGKTMPASNMTLFAYWVEAQIEVTFIVGNESFNASIPYGTKANSADAYATAITAISTSGKTLLKWVNNTTGSAVDVNQQLYTKTTLRAVFKGDTHKVTYVVTPGTGSVTDDRSYEYDALAVVKSGSDITLPAGKVFLGWTTVAGGTTVTKYPGSTVQMKDQDITLYAVYGDKASTVSVTYHSNFGTDKIEMVKDIANNSQITVKDYSATSLPARTSDYKFTGWNTQADGKGDSFKANAWVRVNNDGSNDLYAQWVRQTGTLTINKTITGLDESTLPSKITFTVKDSDGKVVATPEIPNFTAVSGKTNEFTGSVTVPNLNIGQTYTVTENSATVDGYTLNTTTDPTNGKVTVTKEGTTVSFINTYVKHTTAKITITKNVNVTGNTQPTTMPTFQFVAKVGSTEVGKLSLTPTKGTDGKWTASGVMDITIPATLFVKDTVDVKISEVDGKLNYWTYDKNVKSLQIAKNGTIHNPVIVKSAAEVVPTDPIASFTFTNEYKYTYTPPTRPSNPIRRQPTTTTKPVQSVKTGDMGIALYAVTSLLSLSGTALLIKKRKDEK